MRTQTFRSPLLVGMLAFLASCAMAQLPILAEKVGLAGGADPFGGKLPGTLSILQLQEDGSILFQPRDSSTRLYRGTLAGVAKRLGAGAKATDRTIISNFIVTGINGSGQMALFGFRSGKQNLYRLTGSTLLPIAFVGSDAGDATTFDSFDPPAIDSAGDLAFRATRLDFLAGLYLAVPAATAVPVTKLALLGDTAPGGGTFSNFDPKVQIGVSVDGNITVYFNASTSTGEGLYAAQIAGASAPVLRQVAPVQHPEVALNALGEAVYHDSVKLYVADFNGSSAIAQTGDAAPGGGTYTSFDAAANNDAGTVVFRAGTSSGDGLFLKSTAGTIALARIGQIVESATILQLGDPQVDPSGFVAFDAKLTSGASTTTAIFLSDGATVLKAVETGQALAGSTIANLGFEQSLALGPDALNSHGQLAFTATLVTGKSGVFLATPTSRLRAAGPGLWDDPLTWEFRVVPGPNTPVVSDAIALVRGPAAPRQVRTLDLGGGGGTTTLELQPGGTLTATKGVQILDHGVLAGSGEIGNSIKLLTGSKVLLDLSGASAYGSLRLDGTTTLGGTLEVTKSGGFEPMRGESYDLLDIKTHVGKFTTVTLPALNPAALTWDSTALYKNGTIAVSGAVLFAATQGVYTGTLQGNPSVPASSGALLLALAANGRLTGSITYAGKKYTLKTSVLNVDGSGTVSFGNPAKTLSVQLSSANQIPQLTAAVGAETHGTTVRTDVAFASTSPYVGHYTVALPPDPAHTEATFPHGTGYGLLSVSSHGQAKLTGVLGDGTAFSAGGPLTAAGEFPFYAAPYSGTGFIAGNLVLHASTSDSPVEGTLRWYKPATNPAKKFPEIIDANITVIGSGFQTRPALLNFTEGHAIFTATGSADKAVTLDRHNTFRADNGESFSMAFTANKFGLGTGSFFDDTRLQHSMSGVALQQQNQVLGFFKETSQTGPVQIK